MNRVEFDASDGAELAEMLTSIGDWLAGPDSGLLAESFHRSVGVDAYDLADRRSDLAASRSCSATTTANSSLQQHEQFFAAAHDTLP